MSEQQNKTGSDIISSLVFIFSVIFGFMAKVIFNQIKNKNTWTKTRFQSWTLYILFTSLIIYSPRWNLPAILGVLPWKGCSILGSWIENHLSMMSQLLVLVLFPFFSWLMHLGFMAKLKTAKFQSAIDLLGLKNQKGELPIVIDVVSTTEDQKRILVRAIGFDVNSFSSKKTILESALNMFVQDIRIVENNRSLIDIRVSPKELPTLISFDDVAPQLNRAFSFLVGEGVF